MKFCERFNYDPMLGFFDIRESSIHGKGLFLKEDRNTIPIESITHHCIGGNDSSGTFIRTPIGGFINHSDNPNCKIEEFKTFYGSVYMLKVLREIKGGDEITINYYDTKICEFNDTILLH